MVDGAALRRERQALGLTQGELGARLGVARNTVTRWELGTRRIEHPQMLWLALAQIAAQRDQAGVHEDMARPVGRAMPGRGEGGERVCGCVTTS